MKKDINRKINVWIVGDSTVSAFNDNYYMPRYGWGTQLGLYFNDDVNFINLAISGTSSKSFRSRENYSKFINGISDGDFLLIGFGHNDEKTGSMTFTSADGDMYTEGSFAESLKKYYIDPAEKAGASVILVTPIVRRDPERKYTGDSIHVTKYGDYAGAIKKLAMEMSLTISDLTSETKDIYLAVDSDDDPDNDSLYQHARTGSSPISVDDTHTSLFGAAVNAYLIAKDIRNSDSDLRNYLKTALENPLEKPSYWKEVSINKNYVEPVYSRPESGSSFWPEYKDNNGNIWFATVFGDVNESSIHDINEVFLGKNDNNEMLIKCGLTKINGKIMSKSDGLAMYFMRLPANTSFELKADICLESYNFSGTAADYSAFGLMVRDDIYIDEYSGLILGDYVAAGITFRPGFENGSNTFARKSGLCDFEGGSLRSIPKPGDIMNMKIASTGDGYSAQIEGYDEVISGYDYTLTGVDSKYVYIGFFAARSITISVKNIELTVNGNKVHDHNCFNADISESIAME
ncbi:MAG: hypothetical protein K5894_01670 [Lachnospiraceae bacterium]|nr:hypothetical protein [Lachnospiraceae bacterium]